MRLIRWDITINSITTIYVLISVGLAVDYAAHIAHMFKEAKGPAQARACEALGRIGPCVLNAMISTFLAVLMLSFSKSYVFVTMFRAFCLVVVIAGAHGMWLLPVLLTLFAGANGEADASSAEDGGDEESAENPAAKGEDDDEQATRAASSVIFSSSSAAATTAAAAAAAASSSASLARFAASFASAASTATLSTLAATD